MSQYGSNQDIQEWASSSSRRQSTLSSSTVSSTSTSILFQSPATSPGSSSRKQSWQLYDDAVRLELTPSMTAYVDPSSGVNAKLTGSRAFVKNGQLFKLRYTYI